MTTLALTFFKKYVSSYQGLQKLCWQGIGLSFIEAIFVGIYYFLPLYFISELHISIETASVTISFYGLGAIVGGFLGGKFSDKITPGTVSIFSLLLQALTLLALLKLHSIPFISANLFFMGVASYAFITSNHLWVLGLCHNNENAKLKAINILNVASNLGTGLSALIIGFVSIQQFPHVLAICSIGIFISTAYFFQLNNRMKKLTCINKPIIKQQSLETIASHFNHKIFYLILVCLFLSGLIIFQMNTTYSIYVKQTFPQYDSKGVGFLFSLNCLLIVLLQPPLVNIFQNKNKIIMCGVGAFLLGFGMFILSFTTQFSLAIVSCFIYTLGEIIFFSMAQFICYHSGSKNHGHNMGIYRMVYALSRIIGPALGGYAFQHLGSNAVWFASGAIGLFSFMACVFYRHD